MNCFLKWILIGCVGFTASTRGANITVNMSGFQFVPKNLTVNIGDTVTWVNRDSSAHDTVSGVNLVPSGVWRSPLYGRGGSYSFTFNVPAGAYPYYCTPHIFSFNMVGTITVVTPNAPPTVTITNPPNNSSFTAGADVVIQADAADDNSVARVEFYADGSLIGTDFSAPYSATLTNLSAGSHSLTAKAFDGAGLSTTSTAVNISVRSAPTLPIVLFQPQSQDVFLGSNVTFAVSASGTPPLSYQWQFNGTNISGATTNSFFLGNVQTNDAGSYSVLVSNEAGSTPSDSALLNVTKLPNIPPTVTLVEPVDGARLRVGSNIALRAEASDNDGQIVQVEFLLNGLSFATLTNAPYEIVLTNLPPDLYFIVARATDNDGGFTSSKTVSFSVLASPTIVLTEPADESRVALGSNVLIAATVSAPGLMADHVQFFEGFGNSFVAISPVLTNSPYSFNWTPSAAGIHTLMAVVTDELGGTASSQVVSIDVFVPGTQNPTIAITNSPANFSRLTNSPFLISGIAGDDILLERVQFQVNGGEFLDAMGTTNWIAQVGLAAGTNVVNFHSVDYAGNFSTNDTRSFTYVVNSLLKVQVRGVGKVQPNLDGKFLEIGKFYQMIAQAGAGQIFGGWEGSAISNKAVLNFTMRSNLVLTANFISNPFPNVQGNYSGLISDLHGVTPQSSGMIKLKVTSNGKFSGKLTIAGRTFSLAGQFDYTGRIKFPILRRPIQPVVLTMNLHLEGLSGIDGELTDGYWTSVVNAERAAATLSSKTPSQESFTFNLVNGTQSIGSGIAQPDQFVKISAQFPVGPPVVKNFLPTGNGFIPVYLPSRNGSEVLMGWLKFTNSPTAPLAGDLILGTTNLPASVIGLVPSK